MHVDQTIEIIKKIKKFISPIIICGGNHENVEPDLLIENLADFSIIGETKEAWEINIL